MVKVKRIDEGQPVKLSLLDSQEDLIECGAVIYDDQVTHFSKRIGSSLCGESNFYVDKGTSDINHVTCEICKRIWEE